MFEHNQSTKYEDLKCLLHKVEFMQDIITFHTTQQLGRKYMIWIERHQDLIEELEFMIKEDMDNYI